MKCLLCGEQIVLIPSAAERAAKDVTGKSAAYYTSLFTEHSDCTLAAGKQSMTDLLNRIKE